MKRFLCFLFILFPAISFADVKLHDRCVENGKYEKEYKIDRRCYVTDEQKQQKPYNATVGLLDERGEIHCTGTIVRQDNGYFVYTAKHCVDSNDTIRIELQNGRTFSASRLMDGDIIAHFDDATYYKIIVDKDDASIPYVQRDSFEDGKAQIVGYGSLGIMSDKDIKYVKDRYIDYLKKYIKDAEKNNDGTIAISAQNEFTKDGGMRGLGLFTMFFYNWMNGYRNYDNLKLSDCDLSNGVLNGCQVWGGNSGGPLFNNQGKIMGVVVSGNYQIGGSKHADVGLVVGVHFDENDVYKQRDWVASSQAKNMYKDWYTGIRQQNAQKEKEAYNTKVANKHLDKVIQQENKMIRADIHRQQTMIKTNKQY